MLIPAIAAPALFALSFPITLGLAALSWHLVEHPALKRKEATSRRALSFTTNCRTRWDAWRAARRKPGLDPQRNEGS
jgi:peptidoglycan/LPS O-acetylase OafA/YrhL